MWHILEAVTAVYSDIFCNILKLLTARQMDINFTLFVFVFLHGVTACRFGYSLRPI